MRLLAWGLCTALLLPVSSAWALCSSVATSPADFGSVPSMTVRSTVQRASSLNSGLQCRGALLSLLASGDRFLMTVSVGSGGLLGPTGDVIAYTLYANDSTSFPITRGVAFDFASPGVIDLLGLLTSSTPRNVPLYMRTLTGGNVAAGLYQETLNINWNWSYCPNVGIGGVCVGARDTGSATRQMTVSLVVTNDCQISSSSINFGAAPVVGSFSPVNQSVSLSCTKGSNYTVGLSDGLNAQGGRRRMSNPVAGGFLAYDIFKSAGMLRWGAEGSARRSIVDADINPGVSTGTGNQVFNYNARVYTDQPTPPEGSYSDSVILDVQF